MIDLRNASPEAFLEQLKAAMGGDGLLTYRYLGRKTVSMHGADQDSMKLRRDMRLPSGGLMAAPLAIGTAEAGGFTDFDAVPAPITAGVSFLDTMQDVREIIIRPEVIHTGRTMGFSRSVVVDADKPDRVLAVTSGVGVKLAAAPEDTGERLEFSEEVTDRADLPPLHEVFGVRQREGGDWELPALSAETTSTSGSLHLGPIHLLMDRAGLDAMEALAGRPVVAMLDWQVMFVARGIVGPFTVECRPALNTAHAGQGLRGICQMTLKDEGRNRTVATATAHYCF